MTSADDAYELAFTQGLRWLDDQAARVDTLRSRIGTLISAAGVVGGFLVAQVFSTDRRHALTLWGYAGLLVSLAALAVITLALVHLWWPTRDFRVNLDPRVIVAGVDAEPDASIGSVYRDFAGDIGNAADQNQVVLTRLQRWFARAAIAFLVGAAGLGVALWDVLT